MYVKRAVKVCIFLCIGSPPPSPWLNFSEVFQCTTTSNGGGDGGSVVASGGGSSGSSSGSNSSGSSRRSSNSSESSLKRVVVSAFRLLSNALLYFIDLTTYAFNCKHTRVTANYTLDWPKYLAALHILVMVLVVVVEVVN